MRRETIFLFAVLAALFLAKGNLENLLVANVNPDTFTRWDPLFKKYGALYRIPWRWLKAICMTESNLGEARSVKHGLANPTDVEASKSSDGLSWGLMQTTLTRARELEGMQIQVPYLNDPENSIRLGAKHVKRAIEIFGLSDRESVIRSYNGGYGFKRTAGGQTLTPIYYVKFLGNLAVVMQKQPGDEMEFS